MPAGLQRTAGNSLVQRALVARQAAAAGGVIDAHAAARFGIATQLTRVLPLLDDDQVGRIAAVIEAGRRGERLELHRHRIHLDGSPLLDETIFRPRSDNPDEARFLAGLKAHFRANGLWLLIGDGATPELWLSLGPEPDRSKVIPTVLGVVTRESLLDVSVIGANYYDMVDRGPAYQRFHHQADRIDHAIEDGRTEHEMQQKARDDTFSAIVSYTDAFGGADFPDIVHWDNAHAAVVGARDRYNAGQVTVAQNQLASALRIIRDVASDLAEYERRTQKGGAAAVRWSGRVVIAATAIEIVLAPFAVIGAGGGAAATESVVVEGGAATVDEQAVAQEFMSSWEGEAGYFESAESVEVVETPGGAGTRPSWSNEAGRGGVYGR